MLQAAERRGMKVVWDLCHYGYPDHLDIWSNEFPDCFAAYARRLAEIVRDESTQSPVYCPINEISFWAWAGGELGHMNPGSLGRGNELKEQLVRAAIAATHAIRGVDPRAHFICAEPIIQVVPTHPAEADSARAYTQSQYEATDMLLGMCHPEIGGSPDCVDAIGVNFYPSNQWFLDRGVIPLGHHCFRPLRDMLQDLHSRYPDKEILIAETGAEGSARAAWMYYVCSEVQAARDNGVPVTGICLYPILDYPGWENDRPCEVGLFSGDHDRSVHPHFLAELRRQQARLSSPTRVDSRLYPSCA
ncbi:MAG: Beta-glucosidase [Hyphomicrobiales bacterium]|nr:Beta-glucosidase [Hyphomicrobiales bacterium]